MRSQYRSSRSTILLVISLGIGVGLLSPGTTLAAEYFGQASVRLRLTNVDGRTLPAASTTTTFVEASVATSTSGAGLTYAGSETSTNAGAIDGFGTALGVAGASNGSPSHTDGRWLGGVLVESTTDLDVLANVSYFSAVAGTVAVPEEVASAGATLDLVFGTVYADCLNGQSSVLDIDLDCFDIVVRIPLDDQSGVAIPDFLTHTTVFGNTGVTLAADLVEGAPNDPTPLPSGAEHQAAIGISADTPILVGIEATVAGDAVVTDTPHCFGVAATIVGTEGIDHIRGTNGNDVIVALGGDDVVSGKAGDDLICGGDGDDKLVGHKDDDRVAGERGDDKIDGYYGDDYITAGPGDDFVQGCDGDDVVRGDAGDDALRGERGDDLILGGTGNDSIKGAAGNDVVIGGEDVTIDVSVTLSGFAPIAFRTVVEGDNDRVNGDRNNDIVEGGPGNDVLKGNAGDDVISGGSGVDTLSGGGGSGDACIDDISNSSYRSCETL